MSGCCRCSGRWIGGMLWLSGTRILTGTPIMWMSALVWVMAEEMNVTINRLNKYWRSIKEKGDPNTSPAVDALLDLLFMGRQIKVHVVSVAQMASARTLGVGGAGELRDPVFGAVFGECVADVVS